MRFKEISFENFGPIKTGRIRLGRINVFFGPNNSGKSLASRLIHGINSAPTPSKLLSSPFVKRYQQQEDIDPDNLHLHAILHNSGIHPLEAVSHKEEKCSIRVRYPRKSSSFEIDRKSRDEKRTISHMIHFILQESVDSYNSVYIPAGRTGTVQFFTRIVNIRNRLLSDLLHTFEGRDFTRSQKITAKDIREFTRSVDKLPEYLEQFHNMILLSQTDGLDKNIQKWFSNLFPGSIKLLESYLGLHHLAYKDPTGFVTDLESAGSGTLSAFPILAGMHYAKPKGTLIVEEPEAHLEPSRQLKLLGILQDAAYQKDISLILTTHSDYVINKLLTLVSNQTIGHSDLNLYYFERAAGTATTIKHIKVDKNGEAEQPLFDEAIDDLINGFTS